VFHTCIKHTTTMCKNYKHMKNKNHMISKHKICDVLSFYTIIPLSILYNMSLSTSTLLALYHAVLFNQLLPFQPSTTQCVFINFYPLNPSHQNLSLLSSTLSTFWNMSLSMLTLLSLYNTTFLYQPLPFQSSTASLYEHL
jgi:hypothetical protein